MKVNSKYYNKLKLICVIEESTSAAEKSRVNQMAQTSTPRHDTLWLAIKIECGDGSMTIFTKCFYEYIYVILN